MREPALAQQRQLLVSLLKAAKDRQGSPLSETELLEFRDKAPPQQCLSAAFAFKKAGV